MMALKQATILFALVAAAAGLTYNPNDFKPERYFCPPIATDPNLDVAWLRSVDYWFLPKGSKRDFYLAVKGSTSSNEFKSTTDQQVQGSCFMLTGFKPDCVFVELYGLNRKMFEWTYSFRPNRNGIIDFFLNEEYAWTSYIVLTDNKTYRLQIDEHRDGTRDYRVAAVSDTISSSEWDKIWKKIESYGFKKSETYSTKSPCASDSYVQQVLAGKAK